MKVDGVSFADGFVEAFKSEADFIREMSQPGYVHLFDGPKRNETLKQVYKMHHQKKAVANKK